ncbi:MAG: hypothetical protein L0Y72_28100 [Gemmataceae bacterium]|nr:hypothetical protein [Gemmataceae bacterium]MCI0742910.1 hypothetical protein [Gemmataceae bacterium]
MANPGQILKEIHRFRKLIQDLQARIEQAPRALKAHDIKIAQQEDSLKKTQDAIKQLKVKIHDREVSIKASEQLIAKLEKTDIHSKKEYDALQSEIKQSRQQIRKLEDEILEAMSENEEKSKQLPELEKAVAKAKAESGQWEKDHQERLAVWTEEIANAKQQLAEVEATLPDDILERYKRLLAAKGADAFAAIANKICVACYTEITAQMYLNLVRGQFVICKNCDRMLYVAEG